jgi:hypothetical protein
LSRSILSIRFSCNATGVDFRVPTDEELDALAAYQLSLGRQVDFDLPALTLKSSLASRGKTLYLDSGDLFERRPAGRSLSGSVEPRVILASTG